MTLATALTAIGRDPAARAAMIDLLVAYEKHPDHRHTRVREDVTGPIADALHAEAGVVRKTLRNGLVFDFPYASKIARDFVLADPALPDHVWEPQTTRLLLHLASGGGDAIVGGAYFGDQAIPVAAALRGRGRCYAFEPDVDQAAMLENNAGLNGLDNLEVDRRALWHTAGVRLAFRGADSTTGAAEGGDDVNATTVDAYAADRAIWRIALVMLDVEGGETAILQGMAATIARDRPAIVFETHARYVDWSQGLAATPACALLAKAGYTILAVRDFQSNVELARCPIELVPLDSAFLDGPPHGFNLVAVPDGAMLSDPAFRIVPGVSPKYLRHGDSRLHHPMGGL